MENAAVLASNPSFARLTTDSATARHAVVARRPLIERKSSSPRWSARAMPEAPRAAVEVVRLLRDPDQLASVKWWPTHRSYTQPPSTPPTQGATIGTHHHA